MVAGNDENLMKEANNALPSKTKVYGNEAGQTSEKKSKLYEDIFNVDSHPKPYTYKNN